MGTRADFYTKTARKFIYHGSVGYDGYPDAIEKSILEARSRRNFEREVRIALKGRDDSTRPSDGWPWPWEDSGTSDFAYVFDTKENKTFISNFGGPLHTINQVRSFDKLYKRWKKRDDANPDKAGPEPEFESYLARRGFSQEPNFPNMKAIQKVAFGKRSGLLIIRS